MDRTDSFQDSTSCTEVSSTQTAASPKKTEIENIESQDRDLVFPAWRNTTMRNENEDSFLGYQTGSWYDENNFRFSNNLLYNGLMSADHAESVAFTENDQNRGTRYSDHIFENNLIEKRYLSGIQLSSGAGLHAQYSADNIFQTDNVRVPILSNAPLPSFFDQRIFPSSMISKGKVQSDIINNGAEIYLERSISSEPGSINISSNNMEHSYTIFNDARSQSYQPRQSNAIGLLNQENSFTHTPSLQISHPQKSLLEEGYRPSGRHTFSLSAEHEYFPLREDKSFFSTEETCNRPNVSSNNWIPEKLSNCLERDFLLPLFYGENLPEIKCKNIPGHVHFYKSDSLLPRFENYLTFLDSYIAGAYGCFVSDIVALRSIRIQNIIDSLNYGCNTPYSSKHKQESNLSSTSIFKREVRRNDDDIVMSSESKDYVTINESEKLSGESIEQNLDPCSDDSSNNDRISINDVPDEMISQPPNFSISIGLLARDIFQPLKPSTNPQFVSPMEEEYIPQIKPRCMNFNNTRTSNCLHFNSPLLYGVHQPELNCKNVPGHVHFYGSEELPDSYIKKFIIFLDGYITGAYGCLERDMQKIAEESIHLQNIASSHKNKRGKENNLLSNKNNYSANFEMETDKSNTLRVPKKSLQENDEPMDLVVRGADDASHSSTTRNKDDSNSLTNQEIELYIQRKRKHSSFDLESDYINDQDVYSARRSSTDDSMQNAYLRHTLMIQNSVNYFLDLSTKADYSDVNIRNNSNNQRISHVSNLFNNEGCSDNRMLSNSSSHINQNDNTIGEFQHIGHRRAQAFEERDMPQLQEIDSLELTSNCNRAPFIDYQEIDYFKLLEQEELLNILQMQSHDNQSDASGSNEINNFPIVEDETSEAVVSSSCSPLPYSVSSRPHYPRTLTSPVQLMEEESQPDVYSYL